MWRIPLSDLNFDQRETDAVVDTVKSGWLTMGPRTQEFETWFASAHQAGNAVALANCTCALELAYRYILENSPPEKNAIIVPDITFVATANAVIAAGGIPLLCDIQSSSRPYLCLERAEKLLQTRNDIAAIALVHYAGHDAGAVAAAELCDRYGIALVEDCAHSPGALTADSIPLGTLGFAGCFSFFSNKNLATGEGGMLITDDETLRDWARLSRSHGLTAGTWSRHLQEQPDYDVKLAGHNYRCTEITAALGLVQLSKLLDSNKRRRELTSLYQQHLSETDAYTVLLPPPEQTMASCHILSVICATSQIRKRAIETLTREEIQTSHHYAPIHGFSYYRARPELQATPMNNADHFASHQLTLPLYPTLNEGHVREITQLLIQATL